jgi:hypothetical protein
LVVIIVVHVHVDHDPTFEAAAIDFFERSQQHVVFNGAIKVTTDENGRGCVFTLVDNYEVLSISYFLNGSDVVYIIFSGKESIRPILAIADAFPKLSDIVIVVIKVVDFIHHGGGSKVGTRAGVEVRGGIVVIVSECRGRPKRKCEGESDCTGDTFPSWIHRAFLSLE